MYFDVLKNKIFEQAEVYDKVKNGERSSVVWKAFHDAEWGTRGPMATELENEYNTWKNTMGITRC